MQVKCRGQSLMDCRSLCLSLYAALASQDTVKTRLQTQGSLPASMRYNGVLDCARGVFREAGARGFFKGLVPRLLYLAPASALTFSLYELYKTNLEALFDNHPDHQTQTHKTTFT